MLWVSNDPTVYKYHVRKLGDKDVALCGTAIGSFFMVQKSEDALEVKDCCKICWRLSERK